jgi:hypothetical protein
VCGELIKCEDANTIQVGDFKDLDYDFKLLDQLGEIPPCVKSLFRVDDPSSFEHRKALLSWFIHLICDLIIGQFDLTDRFGNEVRNMDCTSMPLLPDRLMIAHEPHTLCRQYLLVWKTVSSCTTNICSFSPGKRLGGMQSSMLSS